jgi:hypothetical protein
MSKIVLTKIPNEERYWAVIGRSGTGWAYPLRQHKDGEIDVLEAMVDQIGVKGIATFQFVLEENRWTADSEQPFSKTHDYRSRRVTA